MGVDNLCLPGASPLECALASPLAPRSATLPAGLGFHTYLADIFN